MVTTEPIIVPPMTIKVSPTADLEVWVATSSTDAVATTATA